MQEHSFFLFANNGIMYRHYVQDMSQRASSPKKKMNRRRKSNKWYAVWNRGSKFYVIWYGNKLSAVQ